MPLLVAHASQPQKIGQIFLTLKQSSERYAALIDMIHIWLIMPKVFRWHNIGMWIILALVIVYTDLYIQDLLVGCPYEYF